MAFRIVSIGDSVCWGQGLLETEKFDTLVAAALGARSLERFAHSGAVIGAGVVHGGVSNGEVPLPRATVIEQCDAYTNAPDNVDLVLLNGGINDVGVATILNPFLLIPPLSARIEAACHVSMLAVLRKVSAKFRKPSARILVLGYYPILSDRSDPSGVRRMMGLHGVALPPFLEQARRFRSCD